MINIQQTKLPELRDHYLVQYILGKIVNHVCNCELVEQNNIDEMEDYPFATFNWITLSNPTTSDRSEERRVGKGCRYRWSTDH